MAKAKEKKPSTKPSKKYDMVKEKRESCPKCGKGVYLAIHKNPDRKHCGKCSYTQFESKSN